MALTYYLTIDGVDGGSAAAGHAGAFVIGDYSFNVSALVSALSGGGGSSGKATFAPLTVDLALGSGLTTLLGDVASGKVIKSIELQGVTSTNHTVYDLKLSNVVITRLHDSTGLDSLSFDYSQGAVSLTTTPPQNPDGSPGTPVTLSWDVANNAAGATIASPVAGSVDTGGGGAQTYYLTIDGVDGGSAAAGHVGAFAIGGYSFDVSALVSALSGTGGASKAAFSPLTVDLAPGSGLTTLLGDVASGKVIKSIELQGVTSTNHTVYDLKLSNVVITRLHDSTGLDSLSFDYSQGAVSLTTTPPQNPDGSPGTPVTLSWDVANNAAGATIASPVASLVDTGGGGAQTYYLTIDGVDGGSAVSGHVGAFAIVVYNYDVSALVSALSGTGGKATFSPLTVDLALGSGLTSLLGDVASGKVIKSIELQGVTSTNHTVYDLKLSNVVITSLDDSTGLDSLSFDYSQGAVSLTTTPPQNPDGSPGTPVTLSWDVANNAAGATIASPVASLVDTGGGGAQTYYLTIDGVDGGSAVSGHVGAFAIGGYSFNVSALVSALSGGGGSSGKATFAPLTVDLALGSGLTTLLGDVASGKVIKSIELQGVTSTNHTVYDLKLSNVVITRLYDSNSGLDSLSFDYSQGAVSLTTTPPQNPDGSPGTPVTMSWDVANNAAGATIASPVASLVDTGGGGAQTYYLTIDGVDGGSAVSGHVGAFAIGDYNFDVSALVSALSGTGGASKAAFSPLTVDLAPGSGLTTLLGDVASGKVIKSIELQGVTSTNHTVYDLKLSNVVITGLHDSTGLDSLSFDYSQGAVSLTTTPPQNPDGSPGTPVTLSWDVANNAAGATIASPVASLVDTGGGGAQTYYLTIDGVDGGSAVSGHVGAFAIGDYSFDVSALVSALSGTGGASKAAFSPLTVDLAPGSGLTTLLGDVASGKVIKSIELQGVTSTNHTVYDLKLSNVVITRLHDSNSGLDSLSFDYSQGAVSLTTTPPQNPDGSPGTPVTLSWDVAANTPLVTPGPSVTDTTTAGEKVAHGTTVAVGTVTPGSPGDTLTLTELSGPAGAVTLTNGVVSFAVPSNAAGAIIASPVASLVDTGGGGAQTYYLTIDGVDGGSAAAGHAGAFVIGDYSFNVSALVSALSGGGGSSGKATFAPLTVDLALGSGLTTLLGDVASGKVIKSIELQGVTSTNHTVYDLKLSNVVITRLHDSTGLDSLSFDYSQGAVSLTTTPPQNPDGSPGTPVTLSWDVANNAAGATIASPVAGSVDTGGGGAQTYYLTIDGVDGGSAAAGHVGAFAIGGYSFDVSALVSALSGTGGASKAAFSPLTVDLAPGSGLTTLLGDVASGKVIKSIELQGVTSTNHTVYDLKLSNVVITRLHDSTGLDSLSFDYSQGAVSLTTTPPQNPDGSPGTPVTLSWDVANNAAGATIASPVASLVDTGGGGAQTYYLTIDGVDGGSAVSGHVGAFAIVVYNYDVSALVSALSGTGGKATFSPLTVDLALGSGLTSLLGDVASGKVIKSIELQGVTSTNHTVYDLKLSNVVITSLDDSTGLDSLSFDYSQGAVSLTTTPPQNPDGSPGTPVTLSWDVANNAAGATIASPVASLVDTGGGGAQTYYLTIDGVDGGSAVSGHVGAFAIGGYSFNVSALVSALSGGGGSSGKATFAPLTVDLALGSGLTTLLGDVASGKVIKSIELQGVTSTNHTVYDLKLSNVVITRLYDSNSGLDSLSFDYSQGAVSLTTTPPQNPDGSPGTPVTMSWDVANNAAGATIASPVASLVDTGGGGAQTYYLTIDGVDGGSAVSGHVGAFAIGDYNFDVSALVSALSGTGGASKAAFSPLTVDLAPGSGLTTLLGDVASGKVIKSIELQGVTSTNHTVYDLKLSNVVITGLHDSTGLDSLSFDYSQGAVSLTTTPPQNPDGSPGTPVTLSWDVANNAAGATIASPVASLVDTGGGGAQTYYLTIDGVDGGSAVSGHVGAFAIGDYSFDVSALVSALSGTGGASKAAFSPLTVDLALGSGLTTLLGDVASGKVIKSIELQGVTSTNHTVYDLKLSNVVITRLHDSNSGLDSLSFDYSQGAVSLTTTPPQNPDGSPGTPVTLSWDVAANTPLVNTSGTVAFSYQISDQHGDVSGVVSDTLTVDPGPSVTDTTTAGEKVAHGTAVAVGTATAGLPGDTLTLTELTGPAGAVTLGNGVVSFAAPANASGNVTFSYQISDQVGDVSAVVSDTLAVDPGPNVTDTTTADQKVAHGTTVAVGTAAPGLPGDTLTLTQLTGPAGAVTLSNGIVSFAAPANASGNVTFSYRISDQLGDVSTVSDTLAVDQGPKAGNANVYVTAGESVDLTSLLLSLDTPGLPGDTLTLTGTGTAGTRGTVSLSNGDLVYAAPASGADVFTYTVSDQLHETATAGVNVSLVGTSGNVALAGTGNIVFTAGGNRSVSGGTGGNYVRLGSGNDQVSLGGNNNTVVLGDGNDSVTTGDGSTINLGNGNDNVTAGGGSTISLGNGNDGVTAGGGSTIRLGNGNDLVYAGANSTIVVGNGNNTVFAGANDMITIGTGHDLLAFGMNGPLTIGNEVVNGFGKGDTLEFNHQLVANFATVMHDAKQMGADTVITIDPNDSVTLRGVAVTSLTQNNFKFT